MSEDKRRYSKVFRRMWNDAKFRRLSGPEANAQTLWLRLLTGPELTNIPGVFVGGEAALAEALGWDLEGFRKAFAEVFREGLVKADWKARLVWVPKAIHYNRPESPNVIRSWRTQWDELPECALKAEAYRHLKAFVEGLSEPFGRAFVEALPDPSPNQEQEQEQEIPQTPFGGPGVLDSKPGPAPKTATADCSAVAAPLAVSPTAPATLAAPEPPEPVLGHPDAESDPRSDRGVQPDAWRSWSAGWIQDYQASVRRARSLPNWTSPSNESRSLEQALAGFCRGPNANPAKVPGWIADSVTRFVEATRDKSAFFGEHGPRGFLKWLNSGGLDVPVQAPAQYKPSPPPPPAWVSPLHADRLGVAKRANLLSMLTSTGTGSEEWERVKMPVLSGDEQSAPDPGELDAALCDLTELESIHEGPAIAVKRRIQKYLDRKAGKAGAA